MVITSTRDSGAGIRVFLKRILPKPIWHILRAILLSRQITSIVRIVKIIMGRGLLLYFKVAFSSDYIIAYWWDPNRFKNFGDALNPILIGLLSGKKVIHSRRIINFTRKPVYYVIGSILRQVDTGNAAVWGSGFIDSKDKLRKPPRKVTAIRGPLTRKKLLELGVECPEVYGDPALLCPMFFNPSPIKRYRVGFVPHYTDWSSPLLEKFRNMPDVSVIDVTSSVEEVIQKITECEIIVSSSLHGLIVADAYGIPSIWVKISGRIVGDDFKFYDYFQSVGREDTAALQLTENITLADILRTKKEYRIKFDTKKLLAACPFVNRKQVTERLYCND